MKVSLCPNCKVSPNITAEMVKCPKCGRLSKGENLTDTVTKWNNGEVSVEEETREETREETPRRRRKRSE